jgi:large subunit ribosomal protein L24
MQTLRPVTKPNRQRRMMYQAPAHVRRKLLSAHLSPELRSTHIVKSLPVRSGDTVRVARGDRKSFEGKITRIDLKKYRIYVEGLTREKVDGTSVFIPVHPSKVIITRLNLDDKWRRKILEKKQKAHKKPEKRKKKPELETVQKPPEVAEMKAPLEEKPAVAEEPQKEKAARKEKKARRPAKAKKEVPAGRGRKERKPKTEKKTTRRKAAKKTEQGEE